MVGNLIQFPVSGITATYDGQKSMLRLNATGTVPGVMLTPTFQRDTWMGGLKYSLTAYFTGLGNPPDKTVNVNYEESVVLPRPSFNSTSVIVETASGRNTIPIKYVNMPNPNPKPSETPKPATPADTTTSPGNNAKPPTDKSVISPLTPTVKDDPQNFTTTTVLKPIDMYLPKDKELKISAVIPKDEINLGNAAAVKFNNLYLQMVDAGAREGSITWTFQWVKAPEAGAAPPIIEVDTYVLNDKMPPNLRSLITVQGYVIHLATVVSG